MSAHALFSPSAAHRWIPCPGSLLLEQGRPDTSSVHADWGTAAHELAAWCLENVADAAGWLGKYIEAGDREFVVDPEMVECVRTYVDAVRAMLNPGDELMVEQRVEFSRHVGVPDQFGTSDAVVVADGGAELQVHDLKGGRGVRVDAVENPQLMLYALGALDLVEPLGVTPERVRLFIHQPRLDHVSEWVTTPADLAAFAARAAAAAARATVIVERGAPADGDLVPGEKQCRWCKAKATCPALAEKVQADVGADFEDLAVTKTRVTLFKEDAQFVKPERIGAYLASVDLIEDWCKAVRAEAFTRLRAGQPVPGFKLVAGRRGARAWSDPAAAEKLLRETFRLPIEQAYDLKLISPTSAEKLAKAGDIGPRQWPKVQALITQPDGQPSVAPESDKRPALVVTATADEFDAVSPEAPAMADDLV